MKPTIEQLNNPAWWDENAPHDATHYKKADFMGNCGWYNFNRKPAGFMFFSEPEGPWLQTTTTKDDVFSIIVERPSRATEAAVKPVPVSAKAIDIQEGGDHYKSMKIQPVEYIHANGIGYFEGCVIKYVSRWKSKGGIEDLRKAKHFIDLLIEFEDSEPADQ